jgi:hypothetical protein
MTLQSVSGTLELVEVVSINDVPLLQLMKWVGCLSGRLKTTKHKRGGRARVLGMAALRMDTISV